MKPARGALRCSASFLTDPFCWQLVEQCEDEELMDVVLPRLTKILSAWELLLAKVPGADLRTRVQVPVALIDRGNETGAVSGGG